MKFKVLEVRRLLLELASENGTPASLDERLKGEDEEREEERGDVDIPEP